MTLEFEKLTGHLEKMAINQARLKKQQENRVDQYEQTLTQFATEWEAIDYALDVAVAKSDPKHYRSVRPLTHDEPLDMAVDAPPAPPFATIIATDGSQIMPDRHAAYLYYLINVGGIVYHHGDSRQPEVFSVPTIEYPDSEDFADNFNTTSGQVSVERDLKEIGMLARATAEQRDSAQPLISIVDQRLLYWPTGTTGVADNQAVQDWGRAMTKIRQQGASLLGYIDRPETMSVLTLLQTLTAVANPADNFDWKQLGKRSMTQGVRDKDLFARLLKPGQRSAIFVYESQPNEAFVQQDPLNEVCFFYLNPTKSGNQIARIDIPMWVAKDEEAVTAVHSLIVSQCQLLGDYPYVLARADEMAVVGRQDASELNFMIDVVMQRHGLNSDVTAKQSSKDVARGGKTRHEGI